MKGSVKEVHGAPLGKEELRALKSLRGFNPDESFSSRFYADVIQQNSKKHLE